MTSGVLLKSQPRRWPNPISPRADIRGTPAFFSTDPDLLIAEAQKHCPLVVEASLNALGACGEIDTGQLLDPENFKACPSESIDTAVMEKTTKAAVMPISVGWADIGSWSELWRFAKRDGCENHARGDALMVDTSGSLIWSDGPAVSIIGLSDIVVVATADQVLVLHKDRAQDVKSVVEQRKAKP